MRQDTISGLLVTGLAIAVFIGSLAYPIGEASRMGPGYYPAAASLVLLLIGGAILLQARLAEGDGAPNVSLRPGLAVFAGLLLWALLAQPFGLVPATVVLVVVTSLAQPDIRWLSVAITATLLSILGVVIFIQMLGVRLSAFGN